ncbi:MAG: DUF2807 domain-containing protein [Candidatus Azobacteroides sp.]|nr:DUF2807 domain-containing protein [Candidatus Azobacteroides sp.]
MFTSCITHSNFPVKRGNGSVVKQEVTIPEYCVITYAVPGKLIYRQVPEDKPYFEISTDKNILPLLDIRVENNCLIIKTKNQEQIVPSQLIIYTNSSRLKEVNLHGSGKVLLPEKINSEDMYVTVTGSGNVNVEELYCEKSELKVSGSGTIRIKGIGENMSCSVTGSGKIAAYDYIARNVGGTICGSGKIQTYAGEELTASVTGSGSIRYKGNPAKTASEKSGSGTIKPVP